MDNQKRKRVSKKNKRSWRKNTDVKDVQEFLSERSREQITGVPAAEKSNEQLFFEERTGGETDRAPPTKKAKKPLRSELSLYPNSAVPGFPPRKRKTIKSHSTIVTSNTVASNTADSSSDEEYERSASHNVLHAQKSQKLAKKMKENPPKSTVHHATRDLWSQNDECVDIPDDHYLKVTRKKPIKKPASMSVRPSALNNVELPHAGMSYNPSFEDHQELLGMAVRVEEERERAAEELEKKVQLAQLTHTQREKVWLDEMTEGLLSDGGGSHSSDEEGGVVLKRPVRAENRKTKKQRRRERMRKELEKQKFLEKAKKIKMDEVFRLRSLKKEIAGKELAAREKELQRLEAEKMAPYQTRRLGKHKFEELDIECKLSSELSGSFRSMKPEGNLAADRYKSLQKRNIIEPRELVKRRRKYKLLVKEKRSAKLPEELPAPG